MSFDWNVQWSRELRFIDSFKCRPSSLDALSEIPEADLCEELAKEYCDEKFELIRKKGVYLHEYMNSIERQSETEVPPKEAFYSKLNNTKIREDHNHAKK